MTSIVLGLLALTAATFLAGRLAMDLVAREDSRIAGAVFAYPLGQTLHVILFVGLANLLGVRAAFMASTGCLGVAAVGYLATLVKRRSVPCRGFFTSPHLPVCIALAGVSFFFLAMNVGTGGVWHAGDFLVPVVSRIINDAWPPTLPQIYFTKVNGIHLYYIATLSLHKLVSPEMNLYYINHLLAASLPCLQVLMVYVLGFLVTRRMFPSFLFAFCFYYADFAVNEPHYVNSFAVALTAARVNVYFPVFLFLYFYQRYVTEHRARFGVMAAAMLSAAILACDATGHMLLGVFFVHQGALWGLALLRPAADGPGAGERGRNLALFAVVCLAVGLFSGSSDRLLAFFSPPPSLLARTSFLADVRVLFPVFGYSGLLGGFKSLKETFLHLPLAARFFLLASPYFVWRWRNSGFVQYCLLLIVAMLLLFNQVIMYMSGRLLYALGTLTVSLMCGLAGLFVGDLLSGWRANVAVVRAGPGVKVRLRSALPAALCAIGLVCLAWSAGQSLLTGRNSYFAFLYKRNPNVAPELIDLAYLRQVRDDFAKYFIPKSELSPEFEAVLARHDPQRRGRAVLLNPATSFSSSILSNKTQREVMGVPPHWADNSFQDVAVFERVLDVAFVQRFGIRFVIVERPSAVYVPQQFPFVDSSLMTGERFAAVRRFMDAAPWVQERHELENHLLYVVNEQVLSGPPVTAETLFVGGNLAGLDAAGRAGEAVVAAHVPQHRESPAFAAPRRIVFFGAGPEDLAAWRLADAHDIPLQPHLNVLGFNIGALRKPGRSLYPPVMGHVHGVSLGLKGHAVEYDRALGIVPQGETARIEYAQPGWRGGEAVLMIYGGVWSPGGEGTVAVSAAAGGEVGRAVFKHAGDALFWRFLTLPEELVRKGMVLQFRAPAPGAGQGNIFQISRLALVPKGEFDETLRNVEELASRTEVIVINP